MCLFSSFVRFRLVWVCFGLNWFGRSFLFRFLSFLFRWVDGEVDGDSVHCSIQNQYPKVHNND